MKQDLTQGNIFKGLIRFSVPYLIACFLQTFYGLADLFIIGQFDGPASSTGVSVGSQLTHMLTVIIAGLAMGVTVTIGNYVGAKKDKDVAKTTGNTIIIFALFALIATILLTLLINPILHVLSTPTEAFQEAYSYLFICFLGIPFITAYNVISSFFRGMGDSRSPLLFVFIAGVVNIALDYVLIGVANMHAAGAAVATVFAQAVSVIISLIYLMKKNKELRMTGEDMHPDGAIIKKILGVGVPIACQDGFIQIAFLVITAIANARGLESAAAVGIVEKIICFIFLVPSAFLSAVSAIGAQNAGAKKHDRSIATLRTAILICVIYGALTIIICELFPEKIVSWFIDDSGVIKQGALYLRSYTFDTMLAGIHFCLGGFFCAYNKSIFSFISNLVSVVCVRVPGAYFASKFFPTTLLPMGMAAPAGSLLSAIISLVLFIYLKKKYIDPEMRRMKQEELATR